MKKEVIQTAKFPLIFVITIIFIHLYSVLNDIKLSHWGIYPREIKGLYGILSSILIHGSWKHLFNNSIPLLILGTALFYFYKKLAIKVSIHSIIFTGLLVWLGGRPSFHIGASGLVYSLASFLFFSGFIRKHNNLMALSMIVVFLYGGMVWGIFPSNDHISWEGHLFGAVNGLFWALYYKNEGPQRKKYSWELEEDILKSLEGIEVYYEEVPEVYTNNKSVEFKYELKKNDHLKK